MGGGSADGPVASPGQDQSAVSSTAPVDPLEIRRIHGTLTVPVATEPDGASPQPPRPDENDAGGSKSHEENTQADGMEDKTATVTGRDVDSTIVASGVQTVNADNQDPPPIFKEPETRPISEQQLVIEVKGIYVGLVMVEAKCIEVDDNRHSMMSDPINIIRLLEKIPYSKLTQLQLGNMNPYNTIRKWLQKALKVQEDVPEGGKKPSTPRATKDSSTYSEEDSSMTAEEDSSTYSEEDSSMTAEEDSSTYSEDDSPMTPEEDSPTNPEEASVRPYVSEKAAQVFSLEECLHAFLVALEWRAKADEWPEHEELAALTTAEMGEEGRKKVIDGEYLLAVGREVVDQLVRDLEIAAANAEKRKAEEEAAWAKEEQRTAEAKARFSGTYPFSVRLICTCARETPDSPEAQHSSSDAEQQAALEEMTPEKAEAAPEDVGVAAKNAGKDMAEGMTQADSAGAEGTVVQAKEQAKPPRLIEGRALDNPNLYKKVGLEYYVRFRDRWIPSLNGEQLEALIALHRTLLDEHHDFFLASQHHRASSNLTKLASKYAMPARMWRHGIHAFLEIMRQLPDCQEFMWNFIYLSYIIMSLLDETIPQFKFTWVECKGDLARYRFALEDNDKKLRQHWRGVAEEEYTRVLDQDPTVGRLYHHMAILKRHESPSQPDLGFDATVSQLFYFTKSLVVKNVFVEARETIYSTIIKPIVDQNKQRAPSTDKDHFLTAIAHLISARDKTCKQDHLQDVYGALEKIARPTGPAGQAQKSGIRPSAELGLLLCQLLLGMSPSKGERTVMMVAWAPDLVTSVERADLDANMADAKDIHDAIISIIDTTVSYVLKEADTGDLGLWGFIYVLLAFMRSLKTRHNLLKMFGWAFHAELLAPFLNMLLREDETRGGGGWESASQPELLTLCSPLNQIEKPGQYEIRTRDLVMSNDHAREEHQKVEGAGSAATAEEAMVPPEEATATTEETTTTAGEATASIAAHEWDLDTKTPDAERLFAKPLPEHESLRGSIFAREPDSPWYKYPAKPTEGAVVQTCSPAPKVTPAAVHAAKGVIAEQAQVESPADLEAESEAPEEEQKEGENEDARWEDERQGGKVEKTRQEDEQKEIEDMEGRRDEEQREQIEAEKRQAEMERQEELLRDPPLFPANWFKNSKYDYDERLVRQNSVQDAETCDDRSRQVLWLTYQLMGSFFSLQTDEDGRHWISVPGAESVPPLDLDKKMPEVVERIGGVRVVYVDRSIRIAEIKMLMAREERKRQEEKAEGDTGERRAPEAVKVLSETLMSAKEPISKDGPSRTHETEHAEVEVKTVLPAQGVDDSQETARRDADAGADAATTAPADDQAVDTQVPADVVQLTKEVLDTIPLTNDAVKAAGRVISPTTVQGAREEDEAGWTHISDESYEGTTVQVAAASMISRVFRAGR